MWIRSQNNECLIRVSLLIIRRAMIGRDSDARVIYGKTEDEIFGLGLYSSERKALKVLDMIETRLRQCYHDTTMVVFQMPSDEEVED